MDQAVIRRLTRTEVPSGSVVGWLSDVHIPIHHPRALGLAVDVLESVGATHIVAGGDILDMHCLSTHQKDPERLLAQGTLLDEIEPGRWFLNWLASRPSYLILGNHEDRLKRWVAENALPLYGNAAVAFRELAQLPRSIEVLPQASELRFGNLVMVHGDAEFKRSTGGKYPAQRLLDMAPDQSTICGHLHRINQARRTSADDQGVKRTRGAWTMGHMSIEEKHHSYVSKHPNWQIGFGVIKTWWDGTKARWDVSQVEIMFDRRGRPYCSLWGKVFR